MDPYLTSFKILLFKILLILLLTFGDEGTSKNGSRAEAAASAAAEAAAAETAAEAADPWIHGSIFDFF